MRVEAGKTPWLVSLIYVGDKYHTREYRRQFHGGFMRCFSRFHMFLLAQSRASLKPLSTWRKKLNEKHVTIQGKVVTCVLVTLWN